jgi:hypothetical protein
VLLVVLAGATAGASTASASGTLAFGFSDDAAMKAFPSAAPLAVSAGMSYARVFIGWSNVARARPANPRDPNDPAYNWADVDRKLAPYAGTGLEVIAQLWMTPSWANGGQAPNHYPADPADFEDFAYAAALRYPQIHVWLAVNEPNLPSSAQPTTVPAYEAMLRAAYAGIKAAAPGDEVVAGPLSHMLGNPATDTWAWASQLAADHVPMDAFAVNPYPGWSNPISVRSPNRFDIWDLPALWRMVGVPVIVAEYGWSTDLVTEDEQAAWLADAVRVARCTPGLARFTLWGFHDHPLDPDEPLNGTDNWTQFGLLHADGTPKPALAAFEQAASEPLDCVAVGVEAGAPSGWTPLAVADQPSVPITGAFAEAPPPVLGTTAAGTHGETSTTSRLGARMLRLGRTHGRWWALVSTGEEARVDGRVVRLFKHRTRVQRTLRAPARGMSGVRRIALGKLRAGTRFRVLLKFHPQRGSVIELVRVLRTPG